jgi:hypothetical protein
MTSHRGCAWSLVAALAVLGAAIPARSTAMVDPSCTKPYPSHTPACVLRYDCVQGAWAAFPMPAGTPCGNGVVCSGNGGECESKGSLYPNYFVASVIYAVPGADSYVLYGSQSKTGTTLSTGSSWKVGETVTVSSQANFFGFASGDLSYSFGYTYGNDSTSSIDMLETFRSDTKVFGVHSDDMDHNYDQILLLLNARIDVKITPSGTTWALNAPSAVPQTVLVGWLNGALPMPANVQSTLARWGVTAADYPQILRVDPFAANAAGAGRPDPGRFVPYAVLNYEWIDNTYCLTIDNAYMNTSSNSTSTEFTTSVAMSGGTSFCKLVSAKMSHSASFTFKHSSSKTNTSGTSSTKQLCLDMPSAEYDGPTHLYVYVDTIYKTFMLSFQPPL